MAVVELTASNEFLSGATGAVKENEISQISALLVAVDRWRVGC